MKKTIAILSLLIAFCGLTNAQQAYYVSSDPGFDINNLECQGQYAFWFVENNGSPYIAIDIIVDAADFNGAVIETYLIVQLPGSTDYAWAANDIDSNYSDPDLCFRIYDKYYLPTGVTLDDIGDVMLSITNMADQGYSILSGYSN